MSGVAGSALIAVVVSFGVAATLYKIISLNRKPVKPVEYGRVWFAWAVLFVTIVMFQSFVIHPNINTFMVWLGVGVFGYGGIAFIIGVLFGSFKERQMKNKTNANVEKTGNTQNMSKSDNASEIVSKPFKTKIIKQDSDMENTIGDEELYLTATKEVEGKDLDEALWAKCLAIFKGDEKKAKYDYIEKRVAILRQEEVDRIAEEERIAREKMEEDERIAEEKIETERKKKLAKEMEVIEKARKRQQEIKEKEWAAVQKKNEEKQRIRQARDERIWDAIENFLKKRWKLLIAIILVVIAYDLITPDDPKTKTKEVAEVKTEIKEVATKTKEVAEVKTEIKEVVAKSFDDIQSVNKKTECKYEKPESTSGSLKGLDLTGKDLSCANFKGVDLENSNMSYADLRKANLEGAHLEFVNLEGANLEMANLKEAFLHSANLKGANMEGADLSNIHSKSSSPVIVNMENSNLKKANLRGAELWRVNLKRANLENANLSNANLIGANFYNSNLRGANLEGVEGANLSTDWDGSVVFSNLANMEKADLRGANLRKSDMHYVNFKDANMEGADLSYANLEGANFSNANLTGTDFTGANLNNITMEGTVFCNTKTPWGLDNSGCSTITPNEHKIQKPLENKAPVNKDDSEQMHSELSVEQQYDIGLKHFKEDNEKGYKKSFGYFKVGAEKGHIESQYYLAHLYYTGSGVPKNNLKAGNWYEKAANQGHIESQYILGTMFETLHIVTQDNNDYESAASWYKKAADQGHSTAQYYLGNMYATGRGVSKNDKMAAYWHQKAANQGHSTAQYSLGIMYMNGRGVNKNVIKSLNLIKKSASQGYVKAQNFLALKRYQSLSFCFKYYKDCMTADDEEYIKLWLNQAINSSNTKESKIAEDRLKKWF